MNTPLDLVDEPQMEAGARWMRIEAGGRTLKAPKLPIDMGRSEAFEVRRHPGSLGADTEAILADLGYGGEEIARFKDARIVLHSGRVLGTDPRDA